MDFRTEDGKIEAYVFERHVDPRGISAVKEQLASAPGVCFVAQFVGAFNLFARVVAQELDELQQRIADDYFKAGVRSDWSVNLTGPKPTAPKRHSPDVCALVLARATEDPFTVLDRLDEHFADQPYGGAVITSSDFDLLVDLGADTVEQVLDLVSDLRDQPGIGRTATALAALEGNAMRPQQA